MGIVLQMAEMRIKQFKAIVGCSTLLSLSLLIGCADSSTSAAATSWLQKNAHVVVSTDPADDDFSDLQSFGEAIGDARIVSLGEQSHGAGTVFDMKTRLVKYLHQKKGFDVLMIESGLFDVSRISQLAQEGALVDDLAPDVIFYMYSKSAQGRKALQYVDRQRNTTNPLIFVGMDSQHTGKRAQDDLVPMLDSFLAKRKSATQTSADWHLYKELVTVAVSAKRVTPEKNQLKAFYAVSDRLESELCVTQPDTYVFPDSAGLWCRVVKSLRNQTDRTWGSNKNRDVDMAANAQWLIDHPLSGHKVIIWAHTVHSGRYGSGATATMGSELNRHYGKQMYVVNFTASKGTHLDYGDMTVRSVASDVDNSIEAALQQLKKPHLFVDARKNNSPSTASLFHKEYDYQYLGPALHLWQAIRPVVLGWFGVPTFEFGSGYDGLFYSETIEPAVMNR